MTDRAEALELTPGTPVLGRCVVERTVRRGPLATVYVARARGATSEWYAVRVVHADKIAWSERAAQSFQRAMEHVREVFHPAIPRLVAFDPSSPAPVVLTAHATGPTVRALIATAPRPALHDVTRVVSEVAAALASLHAAYPPIIHRGVCPENIIVAAHGSGVWLEECGLAHALVAAEMVADLPTVMAEPGYLVPDALMEPAGPRADTFALAVVAFEYLTGEKPFDRSGPAALSLAVHGLALPRVDSLRNDVPAEAHTVFARAWSADPDQGYDGPMAFARDLARALTVDRPDEDSLPAEPEEPTDADDLDRAFDAMLHEAPSPPPPSIADLARLVAPPTPLPPPQVTATSVTQRPVSPPPPAALPDIPEASPPEPARGVRPVAPRAPGQTPPPGRQPSPPPLPARWPTLRAAGGLLRPAAAPRPFDPPPPHTSRPASVRPPPSRGVTPVGESPVSGGTNRVPAPPPASPDPPPSLSAEGPAPRKSAPPVRPTEDGSVADDRTPIVGYERLTMGSDPGDPARRSAGSAPEITVDRGSQASITPAVTASDPDDVRVSVAGRSTPEVVMPQDEPPALFDAPLPPAGAPGTPSASAVHALAAAPEPDSAPLEDLPHRPRAATTERISAAPALPALAPLPAPPSVPAPVPSLPPAVPAPPATPPPSSMVLQAAWVLGVFTILASVIVSTSLVYALVELNRFAPAVEQPDRPSPERPDAAVALVLPPGVSTRVPAPVLVPPFPVADASPPWTDATVAMAQDTASPMAVNPTPDAGPPAVATGTPDASVVPPVVAAATDAGVVPGTVPGTAPGTAPGVEPAHPTERDRAVVTAALRARIADCVEGVDLPRVGIGVRYEGATGQASAVRLHGIFADPPIAPCIDQAVRAVRVPHFPAPTWDTTLVFPIDPPRWRQTEHAN